MGGGGGPGREIPEQVIQDALNNGEDFTLEENDTSTFTEDFEIPEGRTLTVKGTIDLGDGNTLTENGTLIIDGGSITNLASDIIFNGNTEIKNGFINIDGDMTVRGNITFTNSIQNKVITAKTLTIDDNADLLVTDSLETRLGFLALVLRPQLRIFEGVFLTVSETVDIEPLGVLQIAEKSNLRLDVGSIMNVEGTINMEGTIDLNDAPSIGNQGTINVINGGKIVNISENSQAIINNEGFSEIAQPEININGALSKIENVKISNNTVTIGTPDSATGRVFLGRFNEAPAQLSSSLGAGALTWGSEFQDRTKITCYTSQGVWFVDNDSIQFSKEGATENFPQGTATPVGDIDKYPQSDNPGFLIEDDGADKEGSVFQLDAINDPNGQKISVDP